jgi:GT2 family glycosyltransferase
MNGAPLEAGSPRRLSAVANVSESTVAAAGPMVQVDFAQVFDDYLLVYGWIFGLSKTITRAELRHGDSAVDLLGRAVRVPRPDVTRHLAAYAVEGDDHGFCLMVGVSPSNPRGTSVTLTVALESGEVTESSWPVGHGSAAVITFFGQHRAVLERLLQGLEPSFAQQLRELAAPLRMPLGTVATTTAALPFRHDIGLSCILDHRLLLVAGWLEDPRTAIETGQLSVGLKTWDLLRGLQPAARPDGHAALKPGQNNGGFLFLAPMEDTVADEIVLTFRTKSGQSRSRHPLCAEPQRARDELSAWLSRLEPDAALDFIERLVPELGNPSGDLELTEYLRAQHTVAVLRLPVSLECAAPRFMLHLDRVVAVAQEGLFLNGWFNAEPRHLASVTCHHGFDRVHISDSWIRHARADVATYLAKINVITPVDDHGFACYVPLKNTQAPYFIAVTSKQGVTRRLRVPPPSSAATALETARAVLTSFDTQHRRLRGLLDDHVGPAVRAAWASRDTASNELTVRRYGAQPADPALSIIIPLYGRYDLAEYQMALFADDTQLHAMELLYFVDDPTIYDAFVAQCADLYGVYQLPFTVVFCGANLGFAGANNRAARVARGRHLLLMNSDVFPREPGWARRMLDVYASLTKPGLLGFKLLFEDGSVQHAGMSFRPHPPWSDLWINTHPYKGQSAQGLTGVREVDAVTAACALVDATLYRELGGLSEDYIVGDFEDSDLCLRAAAAGHRNRVALDIEFYHLERQSQDRIGDSQWRTNLTVYNCWQHHQRWAMQLGSATR